MICEYCDKPYKSIDSGKEESKAIIYLGAKELYANNGFNNNLHYMDSKGRLDLFEIKHCPMCGKRLKEVTE